MRRVPRSQHSDRTDGRSPVTAFKLAHAAAYIGARLAGEVFNVLARDVIKRPTHNP
ncbi:hypothetical protein NOK12_16990 [Nocardioides sp. OK12]|nr:hypothetical protein NOK12_16990 [Nocardioides sp. OK12]